MQDAEKLAVATQGAARCRWRCAGPARPKSRPAPFIIDDPRIAAGYHGGAGRPAGPGAGRRRREPRARAAMPQRRAGEPRDTGAPLGHRRQRRRRHRRPCAR